MYGMRRRATVRYLNRLWKPESRLPEVEVEFLRAPQWRCADYYTKDRIRGAAVNVRKEVKRNPQGKREETNYASMDYMQTIQLLDNEQGDIAELVEAADYFFLRLSKTAGGIHSYRFNVWSKTEIRNRKHWGRTLS